jgi:hypothetical protein
MHALKPFPRLTQQPFLHQDGLAAFGGLVRTACNTACMRKMFDGKDLIQPNPAKLDVTGQVIRQNVTHNLRYMFLESA